MYRVAVNREGKLSSWPTPVMFRIEDRPLPVATTKMTGSHVTMYVARHTKNTSNSLFWIKTMTSTWLNLNLCLVTADSCIPPLHIRRLWTCWCHVWKPTSCQAMCVFSVSTNGALTDFGWSRQRHVCMVNNYKYAINNDECAYFHFVYGLFNEKAGASYLSH